MFLPGSTRTLNTWCNRVAGDHGLALTFVLAIDGIAILSALATGHEDRAHTRRGAFSNRRTLSVRALRAVTTLALGDRLLSGWDRFTVATFCWCKRGGGDW